ncbi:hypothetical protein LJC25_01785 [Bacteroidales bacterium OttesenSCG-928-K03]|nr:hypothetical protein [Odoribacter sp. OttesenSCG-928-L07]MDL2242439.1 hypothetical protein [Bacteroidales bacterium OttesenSCG-928-K03]
MDVFYFTVLAILFMMENTFLNVYYPNKINNQISLCVSLKDYLSNDYYKMILDESIPLYVPQKSWLLNAELYFVTLGVNSNEFIEENISMYNLSGDVSTYFSLKYLSKNINYNLISNYSFGYNFESNKKFSITLDELNLNQSIIYKSKKIKFNVISAFNSQLFNSFEDGLLISSFLSPGQFQYSLGFYFEDNKKVTKRFSVNFASVQSTIMLNQKIYENLDEKIINGVNSGKVLINRLGLSINFYFEKDFKHYVRIKNSGRIFFPGEDKFLSEKWISKFNVNLENEIILFRTSNYSIAIMSKFDYNRYDSQTIEWYNKLTINIKIK